MPFFQTNIGLIHYAHVPKCGGMSVATYLRDRFGPLAFQDADYLRVPAHQRWTASSPQHVDHDTFERLVPLSFFSAVFTIVRHPVGRAISTYHFQQEMEKSIPQDQSFSDWLRELAQTEGQEPFRFDNHVRPMSEIAPPAATVFYLEHGLDQIIPWLDLVTGRSDGPRAVLPENTRGSYTPSRKERITPSTEDMALIRQVYASDFARFAYEPDNPKPTCAPPVLDAAFLQARDRALKAAQTPFARFSRRALSRWRRLQR